MQLFEKPRAQQQSAVAASELSVFIISAMETKVPSLHTKHAIFADNTKLGKWLIHQRVVLPSRRTSTGWRNMRAGTA